MHKLNVLIACEFSGIVRDEFLLLGHNAISCDFLDTERPGPHFKGDVLSIINKPFDLMIAFPPCTNLAISGAQYFKDKSLKIFHDLCFVKTLLNCKIPHICLENPVGLISSHIRKPDQIIQPWQFGDSFSKKTCLWLVNLPPLSYTSIVDKGEFIIYKSGCKMPKWYAQLPPKDRAKNRSRTFPGIAKAIATQYSLYS